MFTLKYLFPNAKYLSYMVFMQMNTMSAHFFGTLTAEISFFIQGNISLLELLAIFCTCQGETLINIYCSTQKVYLDLLVILTGQPWWISRGISLYYQRI